MREDVQMALEKYNINTFGGKKALAEAEKLLQPDETVLFATNTNVTVAQANTRKTNRYPGVVFLTTKRFLFTYKLLLAFAVEDISLTEIQSIDCSGNGISGSLIGVHTLTKSFSILVTYKREMAKKILDTFQEAKALALVSFEPEPPVPSTSAADASAADEILKYKGLLDCGAITDAEFEAKKKQLLGL